MKRTSFKPRSAPMARGTSTLSAKKPMTRQAKPIARVSKTNAKRERTGEDKLCRGQPCYLRIPGCCRNDVATVVPAHSNQIRHGKGKGIKAHDVYTVPACRDCHAELDQGMRFTREEKFSMWDSAYAAWSKIRDALTKKAT